MAPILNIYLSVDALNEGFPIQKDGYGTKNWKSENAGGWPEGPARGGVYRAVSNSSDRGCGDWASAPENPIF